MKLTLLVAALAISSPAHATHSRPKAHAETQGRIMYWWGKVNQHVDLSTGQWVTDPDGVSGADIDMLAYCQKWYPRTTAVVEDTLVTIETWRERGNVNAHTATRQSFRCVEKR